MHVFVYLFLRLTFADRLGFPCSTPNVFSIAAGVFTGLSCLCHNPNALLLRFFFLSKNWLYGTFKGDGEVNGLAVPEGGDVKPDVELNKLAG